VTKDFTYGALMQKSIKLKLPMLFVVLMAIGQFLCASGSGHPETLEPLPDWINNTANFVNVVIGIMVFIPRTRVLSAALSVLITGASMATNYVVDGYDYFLQVLAFDLVLLGVSLYVYFHYRQAQAEAPKGRAV